MLFRSAMCAPFVLFLVRPTYLSSQASRLNHRAQMYAEFPISWPVAKFLDWLLGESHGTTYKRVQLKTFVGLHQRALASSSFVLR